jgi:tetratricopeptide (TPR) repeat protein
VIHAILHREPASLRKAKPDAPSGLEEVIFQALAKKPSARYPNMEEFGEDLEAVAEGLKPLKARPARAVKLAVLPFANLSGDPDQEFSGILALQKNPLFAPAYVGRAWVWFYRNQFGIASPGEAAPKAKSAALRALGLDANSADAHHVLAMVRAYTDWDWDGAGESWRRTLELNPNVAGAQVFYAHFLSITGHVEEARIHSEKAAVLDPFNPVFQSLHAQVLYMQHRYDEAIKAAMAANYEDPRVEAAIEEGYVQGGYAEAMKRGAESLIARLPEAFSMPNDIGTFYVMAGEKDKAIEWFGQGLEVHDPASPYLSCFPVYDDIRPDPRIQDLLRKMNLPVDEKE